MRELFFVILVALTQSVMAQHEADSSKKIQNESNDLKIPKNLPPKQKNHDVYFTDLSIHNRYNLKEQDWDIRFWGLHQEKRIVFDVHTSFQYEKTLNVGVGFDIVKSNSIIFAPKISFMLGEYIGISTPGFVTRIDKKGVFFLSSIDYSIGFNKDMDIFFCYNELAYRLGDNIEFGFITETRFFFEHGDELYENIEGEFEIGPVARIYFKRIYLEGWYSINPIEMQTYGAKSGALTFAVGWLLNPCPPEFHSQIH
jgi:hypothetical protein